ncbi:MAG: amidophosphoribosyltransferase, partial [Rikenellaceae bacterium]|nr:amidophosphoribosyltransferase [Rikenellaceae bacterium]
FSFIPTTAERAFSGMEQALENRLNEIKARRLTEAGTDDPETVASILSGKVRIEKVAIKDIKLRTFITEGSCRDDLAGHVYDISYGSVRAGVDNLVAIDDSIVRGTTLRRSIVRILSRLHPRRLVIVSSSPQIRYPDFYGIDMSDIGSLVAFRAAVELLGEEREKVLADIYARALAQRTLPAEKRVNCVKALYDRFTDDEITDMITRLVTPSGIECPVSIVYQSLEALHRICPGHGGDWYFSGDYPTPGGVRLVNEAFVRYYESRYDTAR